MRRIGLLVVLAVMLGACGSKTTNGVVEGSVAEDAPKYSSADVIFEGREQASLTTPPAGKIFAKDVSLDNSVLGITADNLQAAFEEVEPDWSQGIVGTWEIISINSGEATEFTSYNGNVTFESDGTFRMPQTVTPYYLSQVIDSASDYEESSVKFEFAVIENAILSFKVSGTPLEHIVQEGDLEGAPFISPSEIRPFVMIKSSINRICFNDFILVRQ